MGSVPPLLDDIAADLHLASATQGLLTSITILFIGLSAPFGQRLAARVGAERATTLMLGVLTAGFLMRLGAVHVSVFLASSAVCGIGMGGASALLPILIAHHAPRVRGLGMGIYTTGLAVGVAIAAGIALPTADLLGGWRPALAVWGGATAVTALAWALMVPRLEQEVVGDPADRLPVDHRLPWKSAIAWWVTTYTTAWMVIGFSGLAWVVPVYVELGVSPGQATTYFVVFQLVQLVSMMVLPTVTDYTSDRRPLLALTLGCAASGLALLVTAPVSLAIPAVTLYGLGAGGGLTMALILVTDVTGNRSDGARLNAMAMVVAYPLGAVAPLMLGYLHDLTGTFTTGYVVVLVLTVLTFATVPVFRPGRSLALSGRP